MVSPGVYTMVPVFRKVFRVQTSMQSDYVYNADCGTKSGMNLHFERIQVINKLNESHALEIIKAYSFQYDRLLIYDKIYHELEQFCSKHTFQEIFITEFASIGQHLKRKLQASCPPGIDSNP